MRTVLCETLEDAGYLVVTASEIGAAVDRLCEVHPDLLIVPPYIDSMPGQNAADYLRTKCPGLPVLLLAGLLDDDRIRTQNTVREFYTFPPPFSREDIVSKVRDVLQRESAKPGKSPQRRVA